MRALALVKKWRMRSKIVFHKDSMKRTVTTMQVIKTGIAVGSKTVYDLKTLYSRLLILSQQRSIDLNHIFSYELSPLPFSLFDEYGDMKKGVKASLMTKLTVYTIAATPSNVEVIDGNAMLYHVNWPKAATI